MFCLQGKVRRQAREQRRSSASHQPRVPLMCGPGMFQQPRVSLIYKVYNTTFYVLSVYLSPSKLRNIWSITSPPGWRKLRAERDEVAEFRRDRDEEVSWRRVGEGADQEGAGGAVQPPEARLQPRASQQTATQHLRHPLRVRRHLWGGCQHNPRALLLELQTIYRF